MSVNHPADSMLQSLNTIEADKIPQTKAIGHFGFRCSRAKISGKIVHFPRSLGWCAISIDELVWELRGVAGYEQITYFNAEKNSLLLWW